MEGKTDMKYHCNECSYDTNVRGKLSMHKNSVHKNIVRFQCNLCDVKAYQKGVIVKHQRCIHKYDKDKNVSIIKLQCYDCDKNMPHENCKMIKQQNVGKLKCNIGECNFSTNHLSSLGVHKKTMHLKVTRYACNI